MRVSVKMYVITSRCPPLQLVDKLVATSDYGHVICSYRVYNFSKLLPEQLSVKKIALKWGQPSLRYTGINILRLMLF